jgi:molecular chaperone GrpE
MNKCEQSDRLTIKGTDDYCGRCGFLLMPIVIKGIVKSNMNSDKNEECIVNTDTIQIKNSVKESNLESKLDTLKEQLDFLTAEFESKTKYDKFKEKAIGEMHRELQEYKNDLLKNILRPMVMDIIHSIDDITKLVNGHKAMNPKELDPQKLIKQMEGLSFDLIDILSRQGVEPFQDPQPEFDPKRQKIIKIEPCADHTKDKLIATRHQPGYSWDGKILRQEKVNVYVFEPGAENPQTINTKEKES